MAKNSLFLILIHDITDKEKHTRFLEIPNLRQINEGKNSTK